MKGGSLAWPWPSDESHWVERAWHLPLARKKIATPNVPPRYPYVPKRTRQTTTRHHQFVHGIGCERFSFPQRLIKTHVCKFWQPTTLKPKQIRCMILLNLATAMQSQRERKGIVCSRPRFTSIASRLIGNRFAVANIIFEPNVVQNMYMLYGWKLGLNKTQRNTMQVLLQTCT